MGFREFVSKLVGWSGARRRDDVLVPAPRPEPSVGATPEPAAATAPEPATATAPEPAQTTAAESAPPIAAEPAPEAHRESAVADPVDTGRDLNDAFDALFGGGPTPESASTPDGGKWEGHDREATESLFEEIAELQARPIRNFIYELRLGTARTESLEICRPIIASLIEAAESIGLDSTAKAMADFDESLEIAESTNEPVISGENRDLILSYYVALEGILGEADQRREGLIIHSLLRQVPDVGHVTFQRLYGAGITSLEPLYLATPTDLFTTTSIPLRLGERICEKLQEHRSRVENTSSDVAETDLRERLIELVDEFHSQHQSLRHADELPPSDPERESLRRECRKGRQTCALQINVLLAELGQLDLADEIRKLGYERKIQRLEHYISEVT